MSITQWDIVNIDYQRLPVVLQAPVVKVTSSMAMSP